MCDFDPPVVPRFAFLRDEDDKGQPCAFRAQIRHLVGGLPLRLALGGDRPSFCCELRQRRSQRLVLRHVSLGDQARAGNSAISRPSAPNAVATIWPAFNPAVSYCAFGESCSRNTSGSTIVRIFMPLSSCPVIARWCNTNDPKPPIEPS